MDVKSSFNVIVGDYKSEEKIYIVYNLTLITDLEMKKVQYFEPIKINEILISRSFRYKHI